MAVIFTRNVEALCGVLRPTLALVVFTWHFDDNSATRKAVNMRSTEVVEFQNSSRQRVPAGHLVGPQTTKTLPKKEEKEQQFRRERKKREI